MSIDLNLLKTVLAERLQPDTLHERLKVTHNYTFYSKIVWLTLRLILIIPVSMETLLNSTVEKISIRSLNSLCMFDTRVESRWFGVKLDQLDLYWCLETDMLRTWWNRIRLYFYFIPYLCVFRLESLLCSVLLPWSS